MATGALSGVLHHLRRSALLRQGAGLTDAQLLDEFLKRRDESAFEALIRRHGPMVLGVCRRILRHAQDAEDAFQATFLVLLRKAASIRPRAMVGNWLYGVAYRTALEARVVKARRRRKERQVPARPRSAKSDEAVWRELRSLLDQELSRLPEKYRAPILLCDVEGKTRREAARLLAWPEGTLSTRLARGRALLAKRLARFGLAVAGGSLAALAEGSATAALPPTLIVATVQAAKLGPVAAAAAGGLVSAQVATLAEGVIRTMFLTNLKNVTALVLVASLAGIGTSGLLYRTRAADDDKGRTAVATQARARQDQRQKPDADVKDQPARPVLLKKGQDQRQKPDPDVERLLKALQEAETDPHRLIANRLMDDWMRGLSPRLDKSQQCLACHTSVANPHEEKLQKLLAGIPPNRKNPVLTTVGVHLAVRNLERDLDQLKKLSADPSAQLRLELEVLAEVRKMVEDRMKKDRAALDRGR
jgi:RNA polymerase sigma factor (sigma-70 family)